MYVNLEVSFHGFVVEIQVFKGNSVYTAMQLVLDSPNLLFQIHLCQDTSKVI